MARPRIVTRRRLAAQAAGGWKSQYCQGGQWRHTNFHNSEGVYAALVALGAEPLPEAVDKIIGNGSWTQLDCTGCGESVEYAVEVSGVADDEYGEAAYCHDCVKDMRRVIKEFRRG